MQIVPVLDILGGVVVRGMRGERSRYRPIETPLAASADPVAVAEGLFSLAPFEAAYVADLDAIEGRAPNEKALATLTAAFPAVEFWVDAGLRDAGDVARLLEAPTLIAVLGSESLREASVLEAIDPRRAVLSLDFKGDAFLGDPAILEDSRLWPDRVIVMTLDKVGSGEGPDRGRLETVIRRAGRRSVFAAGGIRGPADLMNLRKAGVAGALVASALHDGRLSAENLARFRRR